MADKNRGLLDWLLQQSGGTYMSDLRVGVRSSATTKRVCCALRAASAQAWTTQQWTDAAAYLTDLRPAFAAQAEYVDWLLKALEKM